MHFVDAFRIFLNVLSNRLFSLSKKNKIKKKQNKNKVLVMKATTSLDSLLWIGRFSRVRGIHYPQKKTKLIKNMLQIHER